MRMGIFVSQDLDVFLHGSATVEDGSLHLRHVLAESCILVLDLICKLTSVAHNQDGAFAGNWLDLLQCCKDENCCLPKTRLGLAQDVGSKNGLRNANLLDCEKAMPMSDLYGPRNT
jgi:hypothetical protein